MGLNVTPFLQVLKHNVQIPHRVIGEMIALNKISFVFRNVYGMAPQWQVYGIKRISFCMNMLPSLLFERSVLEANHY
jgi:hypothetical protein